MFLCFTANCSNALFAQSAKDKFDALNDYLETVEEYSTKKIIVTTEKVSANMTISIFKVNEIWAIDSTGMGKYDQTFYKKKDWEIMKKKYENPFLAKKGGSLDDKYWTEKDFRHKDIIFMSVKGRSWDVVFREYYNMPQSYLFIVYSFSEPIYYQNRKYLVFTVHKSAVIGGGRGYLYCGNEKEARQMD